MNKKILSAIAYGDIYSPIQLFHSTADHGPDALKSSIKRVPFLQTQIDRKKNSKRKKTSYAIHPAI